MADGNIDQLNFEVILDDKKFNEKIKAVEEAAKAFNTTMSGALTIVGDSGKDSNKQIDQLKKSLKDSSKEAKNLSKSFVGMDKAAKDTNATLLNTRGVMSTLAQLTGVAFGAAGVRRFLSTLIDVTGQFEVQKMALGSMLQDADKANEIFGQYRKLALESPYTFQDFTKYGKQLTAFNIPAENLVETTKMLADVAAGVGVSMDRIILAYGQIKSAGVLKGTELRQLTEAGIPILDSLSKQLEKATGKSVQLAEIFDMIRMKQIPFEMVNNAFKEMTSEGGKFYKMQEVLVETLAGKIGKLRDTWQQALYDIGTAQSGILKGGVDFVTNLVANYEKLGKILVGLISTYGAYKTLLAVITMKSKGYTLAETAQYTASLALEKAQKALNATLLKNPYAIIAAGAIAAVVGIVKLVKVSRDEFGVMKSLNNVTKDWYSSLQAETETVRSLIQRMERLNPTSEKYAELKDRLISKYGEYLSDVQKEQIAIGNLTGVYNTLSVAIQNAARQRAFAEGEDALQKDLEKGIKVVQKSLRGMFSKKSLDSDTEANLLDYIFGEIDEGGLTDKAREMRGWRDEFNEITGDTVNDIDVLRNQYKRLVDDVTDGTNRLEKIFGNKKNIFVGDGGEWPPRPMDWQLKVNRSFGGDKNLFDLYGYKAEENWETYYTRIMGEYEKVNKDILHAEDETHRKIYESRRQALLKLNKDFGGALLAGGQSYGREMKQAISEDAKEQKKAIEDIKNQVSVLEKLRDAYERLEPFLGSETQDKISEIFGTTVEYSAIDGEIESLVASLRELGKEGNEAADAIVTRLGLDAVSQIEKTQKRLDTQQKKMDAWQKTLRQWEKDWGGGYSGFDADLDKVVRDYNDESKTIDDEYKDALKQIREAHEGDAEAIWTETEALNKLYEARKKANRVDAQNNINELAEKYVKDATSSMRLTDWADKSIAQVYKLWKDISDISGKDINIDEELKEKIYKAGFALKDFRELTSEEFSELEEEIRTELLKKAGQALEEFTGIVGDVINSVRELASISGDDSLADFAGSLAEMLEYAGAVGRKAIEGDYLGAAVTAFSFAANSILDAATATAKLKRAIKETAEESRALALSDNLSKGVNSIFGEDSLKKVDNALANIEKLQSRIAEDRRNMWDDMEVQDGAKWYDWLLAPLKPGGVLNQLTNIFKGKGKSLNIAGMASQLGMSLYDEYGNLNSELLQTILDTYGDLKQADKDWIQSAINNSEAYAEAMEQLDDVMQDVFGNVASSAADEIVDGWVEAGSAALDYADILDDVARSYAKMVIKSFILDEVLNEDAIKQVKEAFMGGDAASAMALIQGALQQVADLEPTFQQILSTFDPYFNRGDSSSDSSGSLSSGIKSITEDTAGLLASYINAMRADLSVVRSLQTSGWQDVKAIKEAMQAQYVPSYNEYMAQIAANTLDTAQSNQEILAKLKSVITASTSGGSAVRTTK